MATFSVNQVRQLYVATALKTPHVLASDTAGSIAVKSDTVKSHLYFEYKGADNLMRSDLIDTKNILYAKATNASNMRYKQKETEIYLDEKINGGEPVAGQDYILRIAIRQYPGMSDEDVYFKYGMVHTHAGMTKAEFFKTLAISLAKNLSREPIQLFEIKAIAGDNTIVTSSTKAEDLPEDTYGVLIKELPLPWRRGVMPQVPIYFEVQEVPITVDGDERGWIEQNVYFGNYIENGHAIADLEYFCMGERGDVYRQVGWPHNTPTTYLVDPELGYHTFDIHYAYVGSNESVQKSEKTITIVCADKAELNKIIAAFNTATGLNVATL